MAVLALGVVGSALGSAIGIGASTGWLGGVLIGNLLFGGGKGQNVEGPRLNDLSVQTSTYGSAIPLVYGAMRMSGNVIWSTPLKETRTVKKTSGGKGGGKEVVADHLQLFRVFCGGVVRRTGFNRAPHLGRHQADL
jgi:hypothetical protein